jgi:hypothetical protein
MSAIPYLLFATAIAVHVLRLALPGAAENVGPDNAEDPGANSAYCIVRERGEWRARSCERFEYRTGDTTIRRLMGLPTCWWTASADDFARISGVGPGTALGIAKYRDLGGQPTVEQLSTAYRLGESKASDIVAQVTTECVRLRASQ